MAAVCSVGETSPRLKMFSNPFEGTLGNSRKIRGKYLHQEKRDFRRDSKPFQSRNVDGFVSVSFDRGGTLKIWVSACLVSNPLKTIYFSISIFVLPQTQQIKKIWWTLVFKPAVIGMHLADSFGLVRPMFLVPDAHTAPVARMADFWERQGPYPNPLRYHFGEKNKW